ncbi:MAG TPA: polysaccharide biosynthesis C-terminal domain-containing protein, partial [Saprospiraceae bacterium]|nr:polysaccharide biosynthesis C-terminal domain-containing protein [Saprospiraceae bacterium]
PFFIFGVDLAVQNRTGADYGLYFALFNLTYILQIINDFGLQGFNNRHISRHPNLLPKYFPNLLSIKALLSGLYWVLSLLIALAWGYDWRAMGLLSILLLNQVLVQMILFLRSNISGLGHYRTDSLLSSLDKFLMLFTCGALLWAKPLGTHVSVEAFALAQTLALAPTALIAFAVLRSKARFPLRPSWISNWRSGLPLLLVLFRKSLPYALVVFLMYAYTRLDGVLLERLAGTAHAEVYAGAYRLLDACNMFGYLFASLLLPMFARMEFLGQPVRPLVLLSAKLIWAGSITLAAAICFARHDLVLLMLPERASAYRADTLGMLIWAFVPVCVIHVFSTLLTAHERLREMNRYFIIGIALDVALNLLLIPRWHAFGSAVAAVTTQSYVAGSLVLLSLRHFPLRSRAWGLLRPLGFAAAVVAADWAVFSLSPWAWWLNAGLALGIGAAATLAFGLLDVRGLRRTLGAGS